MLSILGPAAGLPAQVVTLRIAANVPTNSPWDLGLKRLAAEFDRISGGKVRIEFPPSAHVETEDEILQQMRLGIDGAMISSQGLAELYPDSLALSMPSFINNDEEFDAVLDAVGPLIKSKLAGRYVVLALSKGGWVRYFSKSPIVYPSDLDRLRISINQSNDKETSLLQSVGARLVPGTISDFLLQVSTNEVDAILDSPIYIATLWFQLRGKISYMSSFKVAPFMGAMIVNESSWEKVPADLAPAPTGGPGGGRQDRHRQREARGRRHRLARRDHGPPRTRRRRSEVGRGNRPAARRPHRADVLSRHPGHHGRSPGEGPSTRA